ncbi:hypothetical protein CFC21_007991 [Triticum aestivum]|uniref:Uncharacterized protein n=2 Tax=Triticum aestivum TaxID=4565 RepID=A0A3B5Z2A8_WHEAT|nr:myelin transcription factor 1-like [Triticum dicoccoides]XP_044372760.1 myelin transcription factor 1-like [Triticum aestivum]KAF6990840.1 hypothetical protein CFC21_007991 [Triticum aestivum]
MAQVNSTTDHVDLERNSKELSMAAGDAQGNSTNDLDAFKLELIEAEEEVAAAAAGAYDEIVARYRKKRADRKARIIKELGEEAYLEAGDDILADDPDYVDEINEWTGIQEERHKANLRRNAILPGYKKLSYSDVYSELYSCLYPDSESDSNSDSENEDEDEEGEEDSRSDSGEEGQEQEGEEEEEEEGEEELEARDCA